MINDNGFDLNDLVPATANPASEAPLRGQLPSALETPKVEFDVLTLDNDKALLNLIPEGYRKVILETIHSPENAEAYNYYVEGQESKLDKKVNPTKIDHTLRYNLWSQYFAALESGATILQMNRVWAGITTPTTFDKIARCGRIFWLLLPPTDYVQANRRAHDRGLDRLHQILEIDPVGPDGKINNSLINSQLKIFALLDARLNGAITHKHEITTKNVHLGITADQVHKLYEQTQKEVEKLVTDPVVRDKDVIEIETYQPEHKR
jgi:hypothetical protein